MSDFEKELDEFWGHYLEPLKEDIPHLVRSIAARAWEEGYVAGFNDSDDYDALKHISSEPTLSKNPYKEKRIEI